jgi:hypothetical protein
MKNYLDITVVIAPGTEGAYAVRVASDKFGQCNSTVKLPFTLRDLSGTVFGAAETARAIGSIAPKEASPGVAGAADRKSVEDFGVELFEALFRGQVRDLLTSSETEAQSSADTGVRIRLSMDLQAPGMTEVASLPWELMCRGQGEDPMALSTQTTLVRALDVMGRTEPAPFVAPLRIMVVMSNPEGTTKLNLDEERKRIEESWGRLLGVKVDFVRPVATEIRRQLRATQYHVIHYMGHGDFNAEGVGLLLLEQEDHSPDPVTGDEFAKWLVDEPLRLVFLNACKTGTTSARSGAHPFAGVATALIRKRVPAVVAMQFPISDQAAVLFAQTFYECILQGHTVDAAVVEGRKELHSNKVTASEWATPVLYLRSKDGVLFEWGKSDAGAATAAPASLASATGAAIATAPAGAAATEDPWGPSAGDALRVFLTTPDQNLVRRHGQLSQALRSLDWVRVVDSVPKADIKEHAAAVESLVRRADLCVHLLGANPGMRLDDDDDQPLRTYPLVELDIGRQAANSQLVVITSEDKESIGVKGYAALVDELGKLRRDKERFELVITDKNRITDAVKAKLEELRNARQAKAAPGATDSTVRHAFVDSHVSDEERAIELVAYLEGRDVSTDIRTSSSPAADFAQLDETVRKTSLYIIVAGRVDRNWVSSRKVAILKSAMRTKAALLIAKYAAPAAEEADSTEVTKSRFEISALKDSDPAWVDALFAPGTAPRA